MLLKIKNAHLCVAVSEHGAELQSIEDCRGIEYLWQGNPRYWADRAPNIFPYVGRLLGGKYFIDGSIRHMRIHGIAPYNPFRMIDYTADSIVFELSDNADTLKQYPRHFSFIIAYKLSENVLAITYTVKNLDQNDMYFGLGGHPGFNVPIKKGEVFENYRLRFSKNVRPERIGFSADCFVNGIVAPFELERDNLLPLRHELFDNDAIVLKNAGHNVSIESTANEPIITLTFPMMDYVGIWHRPHSDAPYICIEPWTSLPSRADEVTVIEKQKDLIRLEPTMRYVNSWSIKIR